MRLSLDASDTSNIIHAYGPGYVTINHQDIRQSVIVTPSDIVSDWPPQGFADLAESHFEVIHNLQPEIVLLGTGARQQFPHPRLTHKLLRHGIGVEVMDTSAACRTYNIIMAEGRPVLAALLMI